MAAREENILNVPISETLEGMHVLCDTGDTGEPYRVAASLFIAEATQAAKDAVSNLDPKDVILKGFTALTAGKPAITANSTLLAAIQSLYAMVGSGKVKIVSDGADQTGMVSWNGTSASGFVINVNEAAIYTRSQWTQSNPDSVTDANWIAAVKTGGTKTPFAAVGTLTLTTFANLTANASVRDMKIGEMLGFYSSNGGSTSGPGASPLFGYIQKTSSSQVNIFAYTIDGKKSWLGYNAGSNVTWTPVGGASGGNVIHGEDITEGLEYLIPENVGDVVAFRSTMDSSQVPAGQEGFGFLAKVNGSESMAMMMQNDPAGGGKMKFFMGRVQNDGTGTDWQELTTGSSGGGMEALWTPTEATYVMVNSDAGNGDPVQINLTRALKATDRVLITWRKQNTSYLGIDVTGQAIINPNAYEHDVFLELVENFVTPSEYYGLFLDQSTTEAGSEALLFSAASWGGNTYGPQYLITGIYNISGK